MIPVSTVSLQRLIVFAKVIDKSVREASFNLNVTCTKVLSREILVYLDLNYFSVIK